MTEDGSRAIAVALTIECPDEHCRAAVGKDCVEGGAALTRIVVALVRRLTEVWRPEPPVRPIDLQRAMNDMWVKLVKEDRA